MSNFFLIVAIGMMFVLATSVIKKHISRSIALQHEELVRVFLQEKTEISTTYELQKESLKDVLEKIAEAFNGMTQYNEAHDESMRIYGRNNELVNILLLSAFQFILFDIQDGYAEDDEYEIALDIQRLLDQIQEAITNLSNFYTPQC